MNAGQAKQTAAAWVGEYIDQWPGLIGAHLVGGITTMPDDAPFPEYKDVDVHLIFDTGSPMLESTRDRFMNILEVPYNGINIEAGIKPVTDYASADAVLANPEIAHHLTVNSVIYDPGGWLQDLQELVRLDYPRRRWVQARIDFERRGLEATLAQTEMARGMFGASGEVELLGYSTTYMGATLCVATLSAPRIGGRMPLRMYEILANNNRLDLYAEFLDLMGVANVDPIRAQQILNEGAMAFDRAIEVHKTPHPFQHKLNRHLRPYFVESCQRLIDEGYYREALFWTTPFVLAAIDVILADGKEDEKPPFAAMQQGVLDTLGMADDDARAAKFAQARQLHKKIFALADEIVATNPNIVD